MEATPPSPSVFLDLPPTIDGMLMENDSSAHQDNDLVLPYISRMLMEEEDIADKLFYQQHTMPEINKGDT
jgi:hypothetical protein